MKREKSEAKKAAKKAAKTPKTEDAETSEAGLAGEENTHEQMAGVEPAETAAVAKPSDEKRTFVIQFDGDVAATAVEHFRIEVSAVLTMAQPQDEVVVCIESPGGMVHSYGLAHSQMMRIRSKGIPLTAVWIGWPPAGAT